MGNGDGNRLLLPRGEAPANMANLAGLAGLAFWRHFGRVEARQAVVQAASGPAGRYQTVKVRHLPKRQRRVIRRGGKCWRFWIHGGGAGLVGDGNDEGRILSPVSSSSGASTGLG
jgi:hypothetical protein